MYPSVFPAFKEWQVIVEALLAGEQILVLRKGGISEGRGGFTPDRARRFWLFPTRFHAQAEKTKPAAARFFDARTADASETSVVLKGFAEVAHHAFVSDWSAVASLDAHHLWTTDTVRERFDWSRPAGVHVFALRVHRLQAPLTLPFTADMGGCKSWIELPAAFDAHPSSPVLDDDTFAARLAEIVTSTTPAWATNRSAASSRRDDPATSPAHP